MSAEDPTEGVIRRFNEMAEERAIARAEVERLRTRVEELEDVLLALCQTPCPNMYDERWARADEVLKKVGK
jgi:hypothetical protein